MKVMNFTIDWWSHGYKAMIQKSIQHKMKENLLLLKSLLEPWRIKAINTWNQFRKICLLIN